MSRQSLFERLNARASGFAQALLQHAISKQVQKASDSALFEHFGKILLQDSTTLSLAGKLVKYFPGNISRGIQKAVARIQCIMEIKTMCFLHFKLSGFTQNDQSASGLVDEHVKEGDLVIRDLGYFTVHSLKTIADKKAYFLSRLRYGVHIYDEQGNFVELNKLMKRKRPVDQRVRIGKKQKLAVRLVMIPLATHHAAERKRKARNNRDKRLNHCKTYYRWLDYIVFVTNADEQIWTTDQVAHAYKVRWQIEIIFKSWKSSFNMQNILQEPYRNEHRIITAIFLMLLFICLFMQKIFLYFKTRIKELTGSIISLLKLSKYLAANWYFFFSASRNQLLEHILKHCCYERRSDRTNMTDLIQFFKN